MNLITRVGWEIRVAQAANRLDLAAGPLADGINELAEYLLFVDEAPLASAIAGTTPFGASFSAKGPHDRKGRTKASGGRFKASLRDRRAIVEILRDTRKDLPDYFR